ncbi:Protein damX [Erwinia amylovora Ea644]|uniref:SPOR domain-containing protein n=1 Tax=Erwinia amylovora TaxID=552 RepID=UPI0002C8DC9C|nr:SPOR domain-containing protein [Erwinia amylovora]CCP04713.1 Protein damX [Erwinia amylovora Ea644]CCP08779.1 Protein damX [Erwinia amylovora MR1]
MDELKPEDELKPDTSDRRPMRSRKATASPKMAVSRQHMMMGIGILVLLLLVLGIGSVLKSPVNGHSQGAQQPQAPAGSSVEKNIDLAGSSSISGQSGQSEPAENSPAGAAQNVTPPPISSTPTQALPAQAPSGQQRVELQGDLNNALEDRQGQVNAAAQALQGDGSSLPTAAATVATVTEKPRPVPGNATVRITPSPHKTATAHQSPASKPADKESKPAVSAGKSTPADSRRSSTPAGNFTLQLSSASHAGSLNAWAKKQNLSGYHVYQTTRNGQPWYVLVSGSYATPAEAKRAVATLPAEVRAQNPWVKPVSQVKNEAAR